MQPRGARQGIPCMAKRMPMLKKQLTTSKAGSSIEAGASGRPDNPEHCNPINPCLTLSRGSSMPPTQLLRCWALGATPTKNTHSKPPAVTTGYHQSTRITGLTNPHGQSMRCEHCSREGGLEQQACDNIGVHVGGRAPVLQVALVLQLRRHRCWASNTRDYQSPTATSRSKGPCWVGLPVARVLKLACNLHLRPSFITVLPDKPLTHRSLIRTSVHPDTGHKQHAVLTQVAE